IAPTAAAATPATALPQPVGCLRTDLASFLLALRALRGTTSPRCCTEPINWPALSRVVSFAFLTSLRSFTALAPLPFLLLDMSASLLPSPVGLCRVRGARTHRLPGPRRSQPPP